MKTKTLTNAERIARFKARKRNEGRVIVEFWVRAEDKAKLIAYARKLDL